MTITKKLYINSVDVTSYIIEDSTFSPTIKDIPDGTFKLDSSCPTVPDYGDDVEYYTNISSDYKQFGGYISSIIEQDFYYSVTVKGYANKARETKYSGRFRTDSGNGNMKDIIIAIITEKFPDWTYDATSIPDIDYDFVAKTIDNEFVDSILNTFADIVKRIWFVDKNKKFWFVVETTTDTDFIAEKSVNITGDIAKIKDDTKFGNVIRVIGKSYDVPFTQTFSGTGTTDEFTLSAFPSGTTKLEYSDGTNISSTSEGSENYNDANYYDAYFKPDVPALKFNGNTTVGSNNIVVTVKTTAKIEEELTYSDSIERYGYEKTVEISNNYIESQDEALEIAKNYGDVYAYILDGFQFDIQITNQTDFDKLQPNKRIKLISGAISEFYTITKLSISESPNSGIKFNLLLNVSPIRAITALNNILRGLNKKKETGSSGETLTKFITFGNNVYVSVPNITYFSQDVDDGTFILQNDDFDNRSLMVEIISNCDDVGTWSGSSCTLSENTTTYYVDEGHAINIIKTLTSTNSVYAEKDVTGLYNFTNQKTSILLYIKDSTALAKIRDVYLVFVAGLLAIKEYDDSALVVGWNLLELISDDYAGDIDLTAVTKIRVYVNTNATSNTFAAGDIIIDNLIYYSDDNTVTLATYPGILREDFTTTEAETMVYNENDEFIERFENEEFIAATSTGEVDTTVKTYTLDAGEILYSEYVYMDADTIISIFPEVTSASDITDLVFEVTFDNGLNYEALTLDSLNNLGTTGAAMKIKITNSGETQIVLTEYRAKYYF